MCFIKVSLKKTCKQKVIETHCLKASHQLSTRAEHVGRRKMLGGTSVRWDPTSPKIFKKPVVRFLKENLCRVDLEISWAYRVWHPCLHQKSFFYTMHPLSPLSTTCGHTSHVAPVHRAAVINLQRLMAPTRRIKGYPRSSSQVASCAATSCVHACACAQHATGRCRYRHRGIATWETELKQTDSWSPHSKRITVSVSLFSLSKRQANRRGFTSALAALVQTGVVPPFQPVQTAVPMCKLQKRDVAKSRVIAILFWVMTMLMQSGCDMCYPVIAISATLRLAISSSADSSLAWMTYCKHL